MSVFLCDEFLHDLISGKLPTNRSRQRILDALERGLCLASGHLCDSSLLSIKLLEFFHEHIVFLILVRLVRCLEGLYLTDSLVTVIIDLINSFNHSVQIAALDS